MTEEPGRLRSPPYRVKRWTGFDGPAVSPEPKGPILFERVRDVIGKHVRFSVDWALDIAALWVLQSYIAEVLPAVFYVYFSASKGKAKTTALDLLHALAGGLNASDISCAAMTRWLAQNPYRPICIDEADVKRDAERDSALAAICRNGYMPGKPYLRWDNAANDLVICPTYCAKALGFRSKVDDALEDRGFTLPTANVWGRSGMNLVRQNFVRDLEDLPNQLGVWARSLIAVRADARLESVLSEEMNRETWAEQVEAILGKENAGANRETQLTYVALAVCRAACIDLSDSLCAAFGLRREVAAANTDQDLEEARAVLEEILAATVTLTRDVEVYSVRQAEFVTRLNARRKERGLARSLTAAQVASLRNDLEIPATWLTRPKNKTYWNIPAREREALLGRGAPNPPNLPNPAVTDGRVSQVSQVSPPAQTGPGASTRSEVLRVARTAFDEAEREESERV